MIETSQIIDGNFNPSLGNSAAIELIAALLYLLDSKAREQSSFGSIAALLRNPIKIEVLQARSTVRASLDSLLKFSKIAPRSSRAVTESRNFGNGGPFLKL